MFCHYCRKENYLGGENTGDGEELGVKTKQNLGFRVGLFPILESMDFDVNILFLVVIRGKM